MKATTAIVLGFMAMAMTVQARVLVYQEGVGIVLKHEGTKTNEAPKVLEVIPNSPAALAGVKTNWFLISIDGMNPADFRRSLGAATCGVGTWLTLEFVDPATRQTNKFNIRCGLIRVRDDLLPKPPTNPPIDLPAERVLIAQ